MQTIKELCDIVRETAYAIRVYHGHGHLEKVYENVLVHRLRKLGLHVRQQHPLIVYDEDGTVIGEYFADLFVDGRLIIELKAARAISDEHIAQVLGYLKSARIEHGLLINFGSYRFFIKKFIMTHAMNSVQEDLPRKNTRSTKEAIEEYYGNDICEMNRLLDLNPSSPA